MFQLNNTFVLQTLKDASKVKASKKKAVRQVTSQPVDVSLKAIPKLPEAHSESFNEYKHELDVELLKQPLTRNNYVTKFHHLLCWEEQEHDKILKQRYSCSYY